MIPREGYDQIAYLGAKGTDPELRARGIETFRRDVSALLPDSAEAVATLTSSTPLRECALPPAERTRAPGGRVEP